MVPLRKAIAIRILSLFQLSAMLLLLLSGCVSNTQSSYEQAQISYSQHNYSRAFNQLMYPVQHNDPKSLYAMGYMYYYGIGTEKDQNLGRGLIRRAAAYNYPPAIIALKLINQERFNQYIPFEEYANTQREGIWKIKRPLLRDRRS